MLHFAHSLPLFAPYIITAVNISFSNSILGYCLSNTLMYREAGISCVRGKVCKVTLFKEATSSRDRFKAGVICEDPFPLWVAWSLYTFRLSHPTPPLPMLNFLPSYPFANRESYDHILPSGYAIRALATSQISSHATPPGWLCSRYYGQDLSFLRPFHSLSFPLGTLCAWILHIWLPLNLHVSAEHHLRGNLFRLNVPLLRPATCVTLPYFVHGACYCQR